MDTDRTSSDPSTLTEIVVRGRFGPALISALGAYVADIVVDGSLTRLIADVPDQSALLGLLDVLAALNIYIVSVNPHAHEPAS